MVTKVVQGLMQTVSKKKQQEIQKVKDSTLELSGTPDKHQQWFDNLAILELDGPQKTNVAETIIDDLNTGIEYWSQMLLAVVIAALGLLVNSTPVVIGAMLIAPILRPIQGLAFSTATGNHSMFMKSLRLLLKSIGAGVALGVLITWIVPFAHPTVEILARTQPNLLDLFIAMASGAVAFLALWYKKIAAWLAGVAMAASLVPPLAVVGAGIAFGDVSIAMGSWILFATNLIAIIIMGAVILVLFWFSPNAKKSYRKSQRRAGSILLLLALLCVPLMQSFVNIGQDLTTKNTITTSTQDYLQTIDPRIVLEWSSYQTARSGEVSVAMDLQVPQSIIITENEKLELTQLLAERLQESVNLQMSITPIVSVQKPVEQVVTPHEKIDQALKGILTQEESVSFLSSNYIEDSRVYLLTLYAGAEVDVDTQTQIITEQLTTSGDMVQEVVIDWRQEKLPVSLEAEPTEQDKLIADIHQDLDRQVGDDMVVDDLMVDFDTQAVSVTVTSFVSQEETVAVLDERNTSLTGYGLDPTQTRVQIRYGDVWSPVTE